MNRYYVREVWPVNPSYEVLIKGLEILCLLRTTGKPLDEGERTSFNNKILPLPT